MRIHTLLILGAAALVTAACVPAQPQPYYGAQQGYGYQPQATNPLQTQGGRAVTGAILGAAAADALDENMVAGAALGALAGGATCGVPGLPACR